MKNDSQFNLFLIYCDRFTGNVPRGGTLACLLLPLLKTRKCRISTPLFGLPLICNGIDCLLNCLIVSEIEVSQWFQILIQLIDQWNPRGDIKLNDVVVRNIVEGLDEGSDGVSVGNDENLLTGLDKGKNVRSEVGDEAGYRVLQAFGSRYL